jgi:hypothetical protein
LEKESVIDHLVNSGDLKKDLESLIIDEERNHVLTKVTKTKKGIKKNKSDHNPLISKFKMAWNGKPRVERIELFNLKYKACQKCLKRSQILELICQKYLTQMMT